MALLKMDILHDLLSSCRNGNIEVILNIINSKEGQKTLNESFLNGGKAYECLNELLTTKKFDIILILIDKCNIDINFRESEDHPILFKIAISCCTRYWIDTIRFIIENFPDVDTEYKDYNGLTFLNFVDYEYKDEIKELIEDINTVNIKPARIY
jgi:hypothetical protein